jgi:N-acetylmuramoyl-L-alanine amidase
MNWPSVFRVLAALALVAGPVQARTSSTPLETIQLDGREYVRLVDWTKANELEVHWLKKEETLQVDGRTLRLHLTVDSREAHVNGIEVWLSEPIALHNGRVYLSQIDARTTLRCFLAPPKNSPGNVIKTICLDPGHGGKDPGYQIGANQEKKYTLLLAREVRDQLAQAGFKVALTRNSDTFIDVHDRPDVAQQRKADLFVSLHFNATTNSRDSVKGTEIYCVTPVGAASTNAEGEGADSPGCPGNRNNDHNLFLAYQMQKSLTKALEVEDRGVRRARFAVLCKAVMPAILIEGGFLSHPTEGRKIEDPAYRKQMARAIVEGIKSYKRAVEQPG